MEKQQTSVIVTPDEPDHLLQKIELRDIFEKELLPFFKAKGLPIVSFD
jgi:hypothetical protein